MRWVVLVAMLAACGGNEADDYYVGGQCENTDECPVDDDEETPDLVCLTQFAGGYCGLSGCEGNDDCPEGSACVTHDEDGENYCFRQCTDKSECNVNRDPDVEANCSSNIEFVDPDTAGKACVPPSSGV